jgi:D-alanyl-D-alanine endopeptidase (penicillin-binding protein 7)
VNAFSRFVTIGTIALVATVSMATSAQALTATQRANAKKKSHAVAPLKTKATAGRAHAAHVVLRNTTVGMTRVSAVMRAEPAHPSFGQLSGLHGTVDALALKSSAAIVLDSETNEVLFAKNSQAVLPIASLSKLMTALVVDEANLPMAEPLTITEDDVDTEKNSRSRLRVGTTLSREEMLHLALMSSENRAAHALGRNYPGGLAVFVAAMNHKAAELGMNETHYVEPTGLSSQNQSSARDLATLVKAAELHPMIREFSTSPEFEVALGNRPASFHTTNALVRSPAWDIAIQKTGFINEAGRCMVMGAKMAGRKLIMVFLDSAGKYSRIGDAERVRRWVNELPERPVAVTAAKVSS